MTLSCLHRGMRLAASRFVVALAAAALTAAAAHAQTNLLHNGSFEASYFNDSTATSQGIGYVSPAPGPGGGRATVPDWTWTASPNAGSGSYASTFALNITGGNLGETAQDGQYAVSFGTGSYCSGGAIAQSFAVTSGAHCTLSFWVRRIGGGEGIGARVNVTDDTNGAAQVALVDSNGTSSASGYTVPMPATASVWQQVVLKFTAPSAQLTFTFTDTTSYGAAGSTDLGLDNVSITQKTLQTFTILGGSGNPGDVAANTEWSNDGDVTWHPAYLYGSHPWGCITGTNSWINQIASGTGAGLYQTTDYRIRFNLPSDFETQSATFQIDADDRAVMSMNGNSMPTQFGTNPATSVPVRPISSSYLLPGQVNTINIALTDLFGGWVGINYRVDLTGYSASMPTVVVLAPVITSALSATGTVNVPFSYSLTGGNNPTGFGATNLPPGLSINTSTGVISGTPTAAGTYACRVSETNSGGTTTATLTITINKGAAQVTLGGLSQVYDGTAKSATATTQPAGLGVSFSYTGAALPPVNTGSYGVFATVTDPAYTGSASGTLTISPATATITFGNTVQSYDGTPKAVTTSTTPAGVAVSVTYNGSASAPSAVGSYTVVATATDANYTGQATTTLQIQDTTPPVITVPANLVVEATGPAGAIATFTATATDNVDGAVAVVTTPASGSTFPLGTSTVTATATDHAGNTTTSTFTVTVRDTTPPLITVTSASDFSENFNGFTNGTPYYPQYQSGLQEEYNGDIPGWSKSGFHEVHAVNLDGQGNWAVMIWQDNVITSTRTTADNASGTDYVVHFNAGPAVSADPSQATTAADGLLIQILRADNSVLTSYTYLPGAWAGAPALVPVSFHYTGDGSGPLHMSVGPSNFNSGHFGGTIDDITITPTTPSDITLEATSASGAVATWGAAAYDLVSGNVAVTASTPSDSTFSLGTTAVTLTATDAAGNTATASFNVIVKDTTPPAITAPAPITTEATGRAGAAVTFLATATDLVDGATAVHATPASGSVFPLGTSAVTLTSADAHGNTATKAFSVTVRDTTPPSLTVPANQVLEATSAAGAVANFAATAADLVTANPVIAYSAAPGSTFPLGITTVTVSATDAAGNVAQGSFTVTVRDTTPPVLTVPANQVLEATSAAGAVATYTASATDLVTANPAISYSIGSGSTFPLGTTTVAVTATDAAGNAVTKSFTVTVHDTTPPTIGSVTASPNTLWPPNKKFVPVTISVGATDNVGVASEKIVGVATNEPDGKVQWQVTGPLTLNLLSDRLGTGTGRIYTITVEVRDAAGNATQKAVTVTVPHDQR